MKKINQYLPTYIEKFKNYPDWKEKITSHYVFFYTKNSLAEKEINNIAKRQEKAFDKIVKFFNIKKPRRKITYYFYPNKQLKKKLMGDGWYAQAIYKDFCVHCLYTKNIKPIGEHEDTHLLSLSFGSPVGFLKEGLAEYLVGHDWYGKNHDIRAKIGLKKKIFPGLKIMFGYKAWLNSDDKYAIYFYCYAGSFVKFLINKFGKNKFLKFYKLASYKNTPLKNSRIFKNVYKTDSNEIEKEWFSYLRLRIL